MYRTVFELIGISKTVLALPGRMVYDKNRHCWSDNDSTITQKHKAYKPKTCPQDLKAAHRPLLSGKEYVQFWYQHDYLDGPPYSSGHK